MEIRAEEEKIASAFAQLKRSNEAATCDAAMDLAEEHRLHIDRYYYPCNMERHAALAAMYTDDSRFNDYWARYEPELSESVLAAVCARNETRAQN